jgi:hypothetical protein
MTNTHFIGFAVADSMFASSALVRKSVESVESVKALLSSGVLTSCCNASHVTTLDALKVRYGMEVPVPPTPPRVSLVKGDKVTILSVRGLPRLDATRHEYTAEEIEKATFAFSTWEVLE